MKLAESKDGTLIELYVKPNQPKFRLAFDGEEILIFSTEEPVKGKVNKEILKEFTKLFHAKVQLVSGLTSRQKCILILGVGKNEIEQTLKKLKSD